MGRASVFPPLFGGMHAWRHAASWTGENPPHAHGSTSAWPGRFGRLRAWGYTKHYAGEIRNVGSWSTRTLRLGAMRPGTSPWMATSCSISAVSSSRLPSRIGHGPKGRGGRGRQGTACSTLPSLHTTFPRWLLSRRYRIHSTRTRDGGSGYGRRRGMGHSQQSQRPLILGPVLGNRSRLVYSGVDTISFSVSSPAFGWSGLGGLKQPWHLQANAH